MKKLSILIDKDTSYAAEWLVYKVAKSGIVNLVGRPTNGNLAFFNIVDEIIDRTIYTQFSS
ncbi:hypothetical protein ACM3BL_10230 [Mammaliicoccus sciuri]